MAEPGGTFASGYRLDWAVTDGKDCVIQYEFTYSPDSRNYYTNCCVAAGLSDTHDGTLGFCNGGYGRRFKTYQEMIDYDKQLVR